MTKRRLFLLLIPLLAFVSGMSAQMSPLRGTVKGSDGETLPGVSVTVKGTHRGVITDVKGVYSIDVTPADTLQFTYIGYDNQVLHVGNKTMLNVTMTESTKMIEDLVVVGYGTMRKSDLTGSVASVKGSEVTKTSSGSMEKLLQGRISGLTVINNSEDNPQGGATVRVRGLSSINGSNAPLVVVDGIPQGSAGSLNSINPNIIQSIEVLKDASGTAIYGSRGANGVIMVTTKDGSGSGKSQSKVWFNGKVGVSVFSKELDYWRDPIKMAQLENEAAENAGQESPYIGKTFADGTYYPSITELKDGSWPYRTDWTDYIFRTPVTQDYNVGVEGNTDKSKYYASIGYYKGEGMQVGDDYDKFSLDVSYITKIKPNFTLSSKAGLVYGKRNLNYGMDYSRNPLYPVYNADDTYYKINPKDYGNPVAMTNEIKNQNDDTQGYIIVKGDWEIIPGLTITGSGSARGGNSNSYYYNPPIYTYAGDIYNGEGGRTKSTNYNILGDAYLTYKKTFNKNHSMSAMIGTSIEVSEGKSLVTSGRDFQNHVLQDENLSGADEKFIYPGMSYEALLSYFTRLTYTFKDRYLFTFTGRADACSKFGVNNRWAYFPSGAVAWRASEEPFIKDLDIFDQLKIRASFGTSGNQGLPPYRTIEQYGSSFYYLGGQEYIIRGIGQEIGREGRVNAYATWGGMGNPDLGWERTTQFDVGIDVSVFDSRLDLTLDYYRKTTTDLLRQRFLAPNVGTDKLWVNDGKIQNQGVELSVSGRIIAKGDWRLSSTLIINANRNKVLAFGTQQNSGYVDINGIRHLPYGGGIWDAGYINVLALGYPMNSFFGYEVDGIIQDRPGNSEKMNQPGEFNYLALKDDGTLDANKRTIIGDPNPKFTGSLSVDVSHKSGFDLSVLFYGAYDYDIFSTRKISAPSLREKRWTPENPTNDFPKLRADRRYEPSSWFVEDASFLRIQNITLGYTLPEKFAKKFANARLYISVSNPVTFSNVSEYDPEVGENGIGPVAFPRICTFTTGLDIKF